MNFVLERISKEVVNNAYLINFLIILKVVKKNENCNYNFVLYKRIFYHFIT